MQDALASSQAIPVAVGSGTINDLTKLAAHRLNRPYMVVATAASMDGYTAYGASITHLGPSRRSTAPPLAPSLADLDVIARARQGMNASGYADLLAKGVAGADWILADAAGEEPIDPASLGHRPRFPARPGSTRRAGSRGASRAACGDWSSGCC